jgi:hypothetical protein
MGEMMPQTGRKRNAADLFLGRMAREGEIVRVGRGRYGLPDSTEQQTEWTERKIRPGSC